MERACSHLCSEATEGVLCSSVYWLAHGCALVRVAPEHIRLDVTSERAARLEQLPNTAARASLHEQLVNALRPVRGPIRFLDFALHGSHSDASDPQNPPGDDHPSANGPGLGLDDRSLGLDSSARAEPPNQRKKEDIKQKKRRKDKQEEHQQKKEELLKETERQLDELVKDAPAENEAESTEAAAEGDAVQQNDMVPQNDQTTEKCHGPIECRHGKE